MKGKMMGDPNMEWLRLSSRQSRVFLSAWSYDTIVCRGYDLNSAHKLEKLGLLIFIGPIDGGLKGEFALSDTGRSYPPIGLKALHVKKSGRGHISGPQP